jgi:uncharacterized FlaG/YvyC family protein
MGEISSTSGVAQANVTPPQTPQSELPAEERALTRSVAAAAQTLNEAGVAGEGREVTFSFDQATRRPVIKVVETSTKEVVQQWPPEYLLQLAADTRRIARDSG